MRNLIQNEQNKNKKKITTKDNSKFGTSREVERQRETERERKRSSAAFSVKGNFISPLKC